MTEDFPVWYNDLAPLGSAVRYLASLSPRIEWVGAYQLTNGILKPGPSIGSARPKGDPSLLTIPVKGRDGKKLGVLELGIAGGELDSQTLSVIHKVVDELGELWPA